MREVFWPARASQRAGLYTGNGSGVLAGLEPWKLSGTAVSTRGGGGGGGGWTMRTPPACHLPPHSATVALAETIRPLTAATLRQVRCHASTLRRHIMSGLPLAVTAYWTTRGLAGVPPIERLP